MLYHGESKFLNFKNKTKKRTIWGGAFKNVLLSLRSFNIFSKKNSKLTFKINKQFMTSALKECATNF